MNHKTPYGHAPFNHAPLCIPAGLACLGLSWVLCRAAVAAPTPTSTAPVEERLTLTVKKAPLEQVLALVEKTAPVRFRYGALPDSLVTVNFHDEPFLPAVKRMLRDQGFHLRRDKEQPPAMPPQAADLFVMRNRAVTEPVLPATWEWWDGAAPPAFGWMLPQRLTAPDVPRSGRPQAGQGQWQAGTLHIHAADVPALAVAMADNAPSGAASYWCWRMQLRRVPPAARLLLQAPPGATLYVNGAPLARLSQGRQYFDLGHALQRGANCLALVCPAASKVGGGAEAVRTAVSYEWFVAGRAHFVERGVVRN